MEITRPGTPDDKQPESGGDTRERDVVEQANGEPSCDESWIIPEPEVVMQKHEQRQQRPDRFSHGGDQKKGR